MSSESPPVHAHCEPACESLRTARSDIVRAGDQVGAALAVSVGKQPVVDLWAGHKDAARTQPWDGDTIVNLYSVGLERVEPLLGCGW